MALASQQTATNSPLPQPRPRFPATSSIISTPTPSHPKPSFTSSSSIRVSPGYPKHSPAQLPSSMVPASKPAAAPSMSRNGSRYASKTSFDALMVEEIESDEESEAEVEAEPAPVVQPPKPAPSPPMTRTAQKKAAKSAQLAKKQSKAALKAQNQSSSSPTEEASPKLGANGSAPSKPTAAAASTANGTTTPAANGHDDVASSPAARTPSETKTTTAPTPPEPFSAEATKVADVKPTIPAAAPVPTEKVTDASATPVAATTTSAPAPVKSAERNEARAQSLLSKPEKDHVAVEAAAAKRAKWKKIWERTLFTFVMIFGFIGLLLMGHPYMILLVLVSQSLVYREIVTLFNIPGRPSVTGRGNGGRSSRLSSAPTSAATSEVEDNDEERYAAKAEGRRQELWSKTLSWYFFAVCNYFLYGESIIYYFKHIVFVDAYFIPFARHHRFLSFMLYVFGFMAFVSNLRRPNLKHQFGLFCWVHMSLLLIVFSSHFIVNNILEGLIWFWVPASLVICNDVFAYICGMTFGKTPLIDLSPKKTVEGFVGAFVITEFFAYGWATLFQRYNYMICPAVSLGMNAFKEIHCEVNPVFNWHYLPLPPAVSAMVSSIVGQRIVSLPWTPFQLHALVMAAFASLVAPFGGFFASGFKRAFNIKDFGDSIPGHGGLTDRFDCQFLMGLFSYVYYSSLIREHHVTVGSVLQTVVTQLTLEDQVELYNEIGRFLVGQGQIAKP
ncbi:phosphatidate cytidylyltransferase [Thecaphora frezii]